MTTGTRINNHLSPYVGDCGQGNVGSYSEKNWAGTDDPILKRECNSYEMEYLEFRDSIISFYTQITGFPRVDYTGSYAACFGGVQYDTVELSNNDLITLVNRLGEEIRLHDFNAANSIGAEGKDALKQIGSAASSFYRGMRNLKRGDVSDALREFGLSPKEARRVGLHKDLSGKVLATQLGWLPLLSDIKAAGDALWANTYKPRRKTYVAKVKAKGFTYPALDSTRSIKCGEVVKSRRLSWTLSEDFTIGDSLNLTDVNDFAGMLWAGTTLSFIADWFLPIGNYLEARGNASKFKGEGYHTTRHEIRASTSWMPENYYAVSVPPYFYRRLTISRVPVTTLSVPLPNFRSFKEIPSWTRALTAVTLAAQILL